MNKRELTYKVLKLEALVKDLEEKIKFVDSQLSTQFNEPIIKRKSDERSALAAMLYPSRARVTIKGKLDAIMEHLGIEISVKEGEGDSVQVTPLKKTPAKRSKK